MARETAGAGALRVGTDIVAVASVAESIATFGHRYLARVFTPREVAYASAAGRDTAAHLAARFAAKEATMKVLRPEGDALDWLAIEVVRTPGGWCELALTGAARALADRGGLTLFDVSLSHDGAYATAVVVARGAPIVLPGSAPPSGPDASRAVPAASGGMRSRLMRASGARARARFDSGGASGEVGVGRTRPRFGNGFGRGVNGK